MILSRRLFSFNSSKIKESPPTVSVVDLLVLWPQVAKHFKLLILKYIADSLDVRRKLKTFEAWETKGEQ